MLSNKQYFALKASLPYLKFGEPPFLSRERFMEYCEVFLGKKELEYLQKISLHGSGEKAAAGSTEAKFSSFETALRNALVIFRAKKKGRKAENFLRENPGSEAERDMSNLINLLQNASDALEREKILDNARWSFLDEMELDHYADLDALSIYCRKLLILEKWAQYQKDRAEKNLEETASIVEKTAGKI